MEKPTFKTIEEAKEAQSAKGIEVKTAKTKLTDYYKENGLKRNEDYSKDKKHGSKIEKLQTRIDKRSAELELINEAVNKFSPKTPKGKEKAAKKEKTTKSGGGSKNLKYEYPDDIKTPDQRKKYRIEQRKLANGGGEKVEKKKTEKPAKSKVKEEAKKEETKKSTGKKVVKGKTKTKPKKQAVDADGDDD